MININSFGAIGDGVTDDTLSIINFFNSAIENAGTPHILNNATYAVSGSLPSINVSNVHIEGAGNDIHDVGQTLSGTVLKWIGDSECLSPLVTIKSIPGASNRRVSNVKFKGIGINCNAGSLAYGMECLSVMECDIDVTIIDARNVGLQLSVVSTLGEAKDFQNNRVHYQGRQLLGAGLSMVCAGDAASNVSLNEFWCDIQHRNAPAIYCVNSDNNDWRYVRAHKPPVGTATESVSLLGGASSPERSRSERFHFLTATVPLHAHGGAFPSVNNKIYCLDKENGTPDPIVDSGASVFWMNDNTQYGDTPWKAFTPSISSSSGSLTSATATGRYLQRGNIIHYLISIAINTNGTGSGAVKATIPFTAKEIGTSYGKERAVTGKSISGFIERNTNSIFVQFYDGTYPGGNGYVINLNGFVEI